MLIITLSLISLLHASHANNTSNTTMDFSVRYGANSFHTKGAVRFTKLVHRYTNGSIKINVQPDSSLIKDNPLKAVKDGTVAMSDIFAPSATDGGKAFGISALPFIASTYNEAYKLYQLSKPTYEKIAKKLNQKFLYAVTYPASGLYSNKPLNSIRDFKGLKVRTYDKNSADFINSIGGNAIMLPWNEVDSALKTGLVNSVMASSESGKNGSFWSVLKHFTNIKYAFPLQVVTINLDYWNSMNKSQQKAFLKATSIIESDQWKAVEYVDSYSLKKISSNGIKVSDPNKELKKELDKASKKMLKSYLVNAPKDVKSIFKKYNK